MSNRIDKNNEMTKKKLGIFKDNGWEDPGASSFYVSLDKLEKTLLDMFDDDTIYQIFLNAAKVLDIGCRGGFFFEAMKEKGFKHFYGVDISDEAIKVLKERGYEGQTLDIQEDSLSNKFDLIILRHVLEHTQNPKQTIQNCYDMLEIGGIMYVEVPKRKRETDKDDSHFSWFNTDIELINIFNTNWTVLYQQDDFPVIGIFMKVK